MHSAANRQTRREWMKWALLGGCGFLGSGAYLSFEAQWLEVCEKSIQLKNLRPDSNLRILHLSDLHLSRVVSLEYLEKALRKAIELSPDACFITGDFITDQPSEEQLKEYQKLMSFFASKVRVYACMGNHDGGSWSKDRGGYADNRKIVSLLRSSNVGVLINERRNLHLKGQTIELVGLGDWWSKNCIPEKCLDKIAPAGNSKRKPIFLLNHNPDAKNALAHYAWDLMLCGHTHGGQFRVPFEDFAPFAPVQDRSMTSGLFNWKGRVIHVTRGVGNLYGIRLNCRPEISLLNVSGIA